MNAGRAATIALAVLLVVGVAGMGVVAEIGRVGSVEWSGREPGEAALSAYALLQLSYSVWLPALTTMTATAGFALVIIGGRVLIERWVARRVEPSPVAASGARAGTDAGAGAGSGSRSGRGADDERARLDVEVGRDD